MAKRKAIFFDRDGVINTRIKGGYVRNWAEFEMSPDLPAILRAVREKGYLAIIITNQRGVGRGLMTEVDLQELHAMLQTTLNESYQVRFDDIFYCTDPDDTSLRRKPSPAMLLEAAEKWDIDLAQSWMIGDSASDIEAGNRAGAQTVYLITVHTTTVPPDAKHVIHELRELADLI